MQEFPLITGIDIDYDDVYTDPGDKGVFGPDYQAASGAVLDIPAVVEAVQEMPGVQRNTPYMNGPGETPNIVRERVAAYGDDGGSRYPGAGLHFRMMTVIPPIANAGFIVSTALAVGADEKRRRVTIVVNGATDLLVSTRSVTVNLNNPLSGDFVYAVLNNNTLVIDGTDEIWLAIADTVSVPVGLIVEYDD